jgi:multidrug efflux system membrane fusion protein
MSDEPAVRPDPAASVAASKAPAAPDPDAGRRIVGRVLGAGIVGAAAIAVVVTLMQWSTRPQTDDATVRANFVGIAPQVSGHIVELLVHDNQQVQKGDPLFLIDPRPYEIALERARATLALTRNEVDGLRNGAASALAGVSRAEAQLRASESEVARLQAQLQHADDHLKRLEPLLSQQFVTVDRLEEARTQRDVAQAALASTRAQHGASEAALRQARTERSRADAVVGQFEGTNARVAAAEAAVHAAELDLGYCRVVAPFTGKVVNLNISEGAFARAGAEVFVLVDTRTWYVVANFRETQLRNIPAGAAADLYLQSQPGKHFRGTVVGLGWAVLPENGTSVMGLPRVERSLDWIRLAARFPVRIQVDDPDDSFRLGASAVATVHASRHAASR